MICVSLSEPTVEQCLAVLDEVEFGEIRIDKVSFDSEGIKKIFSQHPRLIATCRPGRINEEKRKTLLLEAITAGAAYVDIEVEADDWVKNEIVKNARMKSCGVIISYHNAMKTPPRAELKYILDWCFETGADIAKIACQVRSVEDNARLLGLLSDGRPLVVVGMGERGKITRIVAPLLGSPFTYASLSPGKETAEGQIDRKTMEEIFQRLKDV